MSKIVVTFGEVMGRICPHAFDRLRQVLPGTVEFTFAGAEANAAVAVACLGGRSRFITALPQNPLTEACLANLAGCGVDVSRVQFTQAGRLGLFYVETGANQRPSRVIYDRDGSAIALAPANTYDWPGAFAGATWFHLSGITPALSQAAAEASLTAARAARAAGLTVSCDLNFRNKLWRWQPPLAARELAGQTMRQLLLWVDVVIANEEDAHDVLGISAGTSDVQTGKLEIDRYPDVAKQIIGQFPTVSKVAITLRESLSASHNNWGAMLYDRDTKQAFFAPMRDGHYRPYEIRDIVDRVGAGDSFAGSLIYALMDEQLGQPADAIRFATAASCLAHSLRGDFNFNSRDEVLALMQGSGSGRVVR